MKVKVRTLTTLQGSKETIPPRKIIELEGKELERLLTIRSVEVYEGQELPENARFLGEINPPPAFAKGVLDGDDEKDKAPQDVIFKSDPGDMAKAPPASVPAPAPSTPAVIPPTPGKGKKGKK